MQLNGQHTDVLIVGAGPSGLMMAAQLLRYGIQPVIIDSRQGPTDQSKALAVQARSLEIYRQMGIVDKALKDGKPAEGVTFNQNGHKIDSFSVKNIGTGETPFPFVFLYQQSKNERLLLDYLTRQCCPVYWNTTLVSLKPGADKTTAIVNDGNEDAMLTCRYVVGADGAHSVVRKQLQIPFNGDVYAQEFFLADVVLDNPELTDSFIQLYLQDRGFTGFFPMPEKNGYRIIGNLPEKATDNIADLQLEDVVPAMNAITGLDIQVIKNNWFTTYRLHHRMADSFSKQHCFLIGDAAHIHSPVGGQGMNTGLQDAYNLAWKMAFVISGHMSENILESYAAERMPVARTLLSTTDRAFKIILSKNWFVSFFKKHLLSKVLKYVWSKESWREEFFKRVSQIGISYRDSQINLHLSNATKVKAGDRLPYLKVFDEKKQEETDLHEWCAKPGFTLIVLGSFKELDLFTLAKWLSQHYPGLINFFYLPASAKNQPVFDAFEIPKGKKKAIIVRPDMHIGFINDVVAIDMMDNYLVNVLGLKKQ